MRTKIILTAIWLLTVCVGPALGGDTQNLDSKVRQALHRAVAFFRTNIATEGGYLWQYSEDLSQREGEVRATDTMVWVQPPGTPTVGEMYLKAYEATGDGYYLEAARETAAALIAGQLYSGGWDYRIEFDPQLRGEFAYRIDGNHHGRRNVTTLDDNTTQAAVRLLMRVDQAFDFHDDAVHEAALYALEHLVSAQYPNGAWPQRFSEPHKDDELPVVAASYPKTWSRTYPKKNYLHYYTFNDGVMLQTVDVMLTAADVYDEPKYRASAERGGDFIILAQMPEPQPAWAQQYDSDMHPAWARKFEPPAITGGESQGAMRTLLALFEATGESRFLEPLPAAIAYFRRSVLADGRLARFYELRTNRPLYFTKDYQLAFDDTDVPTHYSFKSGNGIEKIAARYSQLTMPTTSEGRQAKAKSKRPPNARLIEHTKKVIASLDDRGRWVEDGQMRQPDAEYPVSRIITSRTFCRNVGVLCDYLTAETQ